MVGSIPPLELGVKEIGFVSSENYHRSGELSWGVLWARARISLEHADMSRAEKGGALGLRLAVRKLSL